MRVLGDTNILLRWTQRGHPHHLLAVAAVQRLQAQGHELVVTTQNLVEYWAVATRPGLNNGLGFTTAEAETEIALISAIFARLPDPPDVFDRWRGLVTRYGVSGKPTHDARLVATMLANGVGRILTFNGADFARYAEISVETP